MEFKQGKGISRYKRASSVSAAEDKSMIGESRSLGHPIGATPLGFWHGAVLYPGLHPVYDRIPPWADMGPPPWGYSCADISRAAIASAKWMVRCADRWPFGRQSAIR